MRVTRFELVYPLWKSGVLPLNDTRVAKDAHYSEPFARGQASPVVRRGAARGDSVCASRRAEFRHPVPMARSARPFAPAVRDVLMMATPSKNADLRWFGGFHASGSD